MSAATDHQNCSDNRWDICLTAGSKWQMQIGLFEDDETTPYNLSDITFTAGIKYRQRDADFIAQMDVEVVEHPDNIDVLLTVPAAESANMHRNGIWSLEMQATGDDPIIIMYGDVTLSRRATS